MFFSKSLILFGLSFNIWDFSKKKFVNNYEENTPFGRMMDINEVPKVFEFLLDKKSSYVTGTEIVVDGGWTAW